MNREAIDKIARAVLYEGYILYPYRPSVKSQQRWTFGGLYPPAWTAAQRAGDPSFMQIQCLACGDDSAHVRFSIRFLHLIDRTVGELSEPMHTWSADEEPNYHPVRSLAVEGAKYYPWQEAAERDVDGGEFSLRELLASPRRVEFGFSANCAIEPLRRRDGAVVGLLLREQQAVEGLAEISAVELQKGLYKITIVIRNLTNMDMTASRRDDALMRSLASTHAIVSIREGEFISLTDPPAQWKAQAADCKNIGNWPVFVGEEPARDTMLASPIILYDYPQIAPESPGDLFDSTEIDEILSLRILTLTDEEKEAAAGVDIKAKAMLARTESLAREQLMGLHGTMRGMQPVPLEESHG